MVVQLQAMAKFACLLPLVLFAVGCGKSPSQKLTALSEEFVYGSLAFSPSTATATGLHQYQKQNLDEMLDDFGEQSLYRQRTFYEKFRDRLGEIPTGALSAEDRADLTILQDQIALTLFDLAEIHIRSDSALSTRSSATAWARSRPAHCPPKTAPTSPSCRTRSRSPCSTWPKSTSTSTRPRC